MNILVACEYSGVVRDAFTAKGHYAVSCDLLDTERPGMHYKGKIKDIIYSWPWDLMIAHPPCTRLCNSGVRWLHVPPKSKTLEEMWLEFEQGVELYLTLQNAPIEKKCIENPIMNPFASKRIKPTNRQIVQPWWFGEKAFKATGFELYNLPNLISTNKLVPPQKGTVEYKEWSAIHYASPGPNRWKIRSKTYQGIADAMAEQWG